MGALDQNALRPEALIISQHFGRAQRLELGKLEKTCANDHQVNGIIDWTQKRVAAVRGGSQTISEVEQNPR